MVLILKRLREVFWKTVIYGKWVFYAFRKRGIEVGQRVPDFTLLDIYGRSVTLSDFFPEKAVVLWLTNLCSSCEERIGILEKVYEEKRDSLEVIAISTLGDDRATPEKILKTHSIKFPLLLDPEDWVYRKLGLEHPEGACPLYNLLILDRFGKVAFRHHLSAFSDEKFLSVLQAVLKQGY
jgi:peroxiredoxin